MHLRRRKTPIICSFRSFSSQTMHILKWNLFYRFIIVIFRSSLILDTIEQFSTELCALDLLFAFSAHFLRRGCTYWNEIWCIWFIIIISRSSLIWGTIKHFLTELCALGLENFNYLQQFRFIFFADVSKGGGHECFTNISCYS